MPIGVFGKLPQRADFIALNLPPTILHPLEQWLEAAVADSQAALGEAWLDAYLVSPIWRVWIGPRVFGQGCCGAMMPSVDAVGRYFPLVMLAWGGGSSAPASPLSEPADAWYAQIEERLLSALRSEDELDPGALTRGLSEPPMVMVGGEAAAQSCWWQGGDEIAVQFGLPQSAYYGTLIAPKG